MLLLTAVAKIVSSGGNAGALNVNDRVFGLPNSYLLLLAGLVEGAAAIFCFIGKSRRMQVAILAWLASVFLLYRLNLWAQGYRGLCPCLGNMTSAIHLPSRAADWWLRVVLGYILIGSYSALLWLRYSQKNFTETALIDRGVADGGISDHDSGCGQEL